MSSKESRYSHELGSSSTPVARRHPPRGQPVRHPKQCGQSSALSHGLRATSVEPLFLGGEAAYSQHRVLTALAAYPRLNDEWRALLPRSVASNDDPDRHSVESDRQGIALAEVLTRQPHRLGELTTAALAAIAPLHRQTATLIVVDDVCLLRRWVAHPLAVLTEMCEQPMDPDLVTAMDRVQRVLREALVGRRLPTCWTHGHYTPGNVRLDVNGSVIGIEDWDWARPAKLAIIDEYLMILTASCQVEQSELGTIIAARLQAGGLSDCERKALRAKRDRPSAYRDDGEHVDERAAILLTWLHFAAEQLHKRAASSGISSWWAADVAPVLRTVAVLPELEPTDDRCARSRLRPADIGHGRRLDKRC